jgi:hypothetical protein
LATKPDPYVYVPCPSCGRKIAQPFPRGCGPVPHIHMPRGGQCGARLMVWPDPERHGHKVWELSTQTFEAAIAELYGRTAA